MKSTVNIVVAFTVANAVGFFVYRASSTSDAATAVAPQPLSSPATHLEPVPAPRQLESVDANSLVSAPTSARAVEERTVPPPTPGSVDVSENPHPALHVNPVKAPVRRLPPKAAPAPKPVAEAPAQPASAPPAAPPPTAKPADVIQKMEANPYKRDE